MKWMRAFTVSIAIFGAGFLVSNRAMSASSPDPRTVVPVAGVPIPDMTDLILFDTFFDPSGGLDPDSLTDDAKAILIAHRLAQQQVQLAIEYLEVNRQQILAGNSELFNKVFGNIGRLRSVARLESVPVVGRGAVAADPFTITADDATRPNWTSTIKAGDWVYIGDPTQNAPTLASRVARVLAVIGDSDGANQQLLLDRRGAGIQEVVTDMPVYRVLDFDLQPDVTAYTRVLDTFKAIRRGLAGIAPADDTLTVFGDTARLNQSPIEYRGEFTDFNAIWGPGVGDYTVLDGLLKQYPGLLADRALRQAGFSNSDSALHIQNADDVANGVTALPLLWTNDNDVPLDYSAAVDQLNGSALPAGTAPVGNADRLRDFFLNRQTLFSEPDNVLVQYVGEAFLQERDRFLAEFYDTAIASGIPPNKITVFATDANGNRLRDLNGNFLLATVSVPGTAGDVNVQDPSTFAQWQMIIQSYAEHSTSFDVVDNTAIIGVMDMLRGVASSDFRARDASNFALFANEVRASSGGLTGNVEPLGRRAQAGFNPIVPRF